MLDFGEDGLCNIDFSVTFWPIANIIFFCQYFTFFYFTENNNVFAF